jgi:6-phosphogluconolactonase
MNNFELLSFSTGDDLAQAAATEWLRVLDQAQSASPYLVALSGGRITRNFFNAIANLVVPAAESNKNRPPEPLSKVQFFWADERCVPPSDPECNFTIARQLLFDPLGIHDDQVHRIRGEDPPEAAAARAEADLRRTARALDSQGQPIFDLIFLGMGEDGHVASLFPGEPEDVVSRKSVYRAVTASKPPPRRVTLGYSTISAARQVWVLASGAGKEAALRGSLEPGAGTPLGRMIRSRNQTKIFTDIPSK